MCTNGRGSDGASSNSVGAAVIFLHAEQADSPYPCPGCTKRPAADAVLYGKSAGSHGGTTQGGGQSPNNSAQRLVARRLQSMFGQEVLTMLTRSKDGCVCPPAYTHRVCIIAIFSATGREVPLSRKPLPSVRTSLPVAVITGMDLL